MPSIRPVSDLRNHFSKITEEVTLSGEPVFLTKNGCGSLVVMSMEAYEKGLYESEIYAKLKAAELEAKTTKSRFTHEEMMSKMKAKIAAAEGDK